MNAAKASYTKLHRSKRYINQWSASLGLGLGARDGGQTLLIKPIQLVGKIGIACDMQREAGYAN